MELWQRATTLIIATNSRFQIPFGCLLTTDLKGAFHCAEDICHGFGTEERRLMFSIRILSGMKGL